MGARTRFGVRRGRSRLVRVVPDQRTLVVLGALVVGMTVASSALLLLEPGPRAPLSGIQLLSTNTSDRVEPEVRLFDTADSLGWEAIVIHDTGTRAGSAESINRAHERIGRQGLGYHFVINNGSEQPDGMIEVGFRWSNQMVGAYLEGPDATWWNSHAIGISLVGDGDQAAFTDAQARELVWLVQNLQKRYGIPSDRVYIDLGTQDAGPARHFPYAQFRQQLLSPAG